MFWVEKWKLLGIDEEELWWYLDTEDLDQHTLVLVRIWKIVLFCMEWPTYVIIPFPEHQWMQNSKN
jgi:hypothetical protein